MTEQELSSTYRLAAQRALLGVINPNIRMITIGWNGLSLFHLRAYFASSPSEEEIEDVDVACTEVLAYTGCKHPKVECLYDLRPRKELAVLKEVVYSRKE
jgi:hypothetical protein